MIIDSTYQDIEVVYINLANIYRNHGAYCELCMNDIWNGHIAHFNIDNNRAS